MNIVTVTTRDNVTTRMQIGCDDAAANLVAFMLRVDDVKHVAMDKNETELWDRDGFELARSERYLKAFHFNAEVEL